MRFGLDRTVDSVPLQALPVPLVMGTGFQGYRYGYNLSYPRVTRGTPYRYCTTPTKCSAHVMRDAFEQLKQLFKVPMEV